MFDCVAGSVAVAGADRTAVEVSSISHNSGAKSCGAACKSRAVLFFVVCEAKELLLVELGYLEAFVEECFAIDDDNVVGDGELSVYLVWPKLSFKGLGVGVRVCAWFSWRLLIHPWSLISEQPLGSTAEFGSSPHGDLWPLSSNWRCSCADCRRNLPAVRF